jgi:putative ABC transport system substrate-binding protein
VEAGLVASWTRPGGNLTGVAIGLYGGKLLEILTQALPGTLRVVVPRTSDWESISSAAQELHVQLLGYRLVSADDIEGLFAAARRDGADAVLVLDVAAFSKFIERIAEAAARHRMPAVGYTRRFADAGGLLSYSPDLSWPRFASGIASVLNGAKPADLPVEKPTQFELVVNLKAARRWA